MIPKCHAALARGSRLERHGAVHFRVLFIGSMDSDMIVQGMFQDSGTSNWTKGFDIQVLRQIAAFTAVFSRYVHDEAKRRGQRYRERTDDFQKDILAIIAELIG